MIQYKAFSSNLEFSFEESRFLKKLLRLCAFTFQLNFLQVNKR